MSTFSASVASSGFALLLFAAAIPVQAQTLNQSEPQTPVSVSKVRIVRLSEIRGTVQLDRSNGHGYEPAMVNLPVVEGNSLKTGVGVAEIEFEDNSTLRVGPYSEVQFPLLGRTNQGTTVSTIHLLEGTAYVSLVKIRGNAPNVFDLAFGRDRNLHLQPDTHLRLEVDGQEARLAVLSGTVHVNGPNQGIDVSHKNTATFALAGDPLPTVAKKVADDPLDSWDKQLDQYHSRVASMTNLGGVPYSYGLTDMSYYGAFQNIGGCGMMWRPYFASAAWDPYANGTWAYYNDAGYSWVSPYPWGWTPYHYGSWSFCPGAGWGWMPGGSWLGINNIASTAAPAKGITAARPLPPRAPRVGEPSLVSVKAANFVRSGPDSSGSFVFRKDSAGLGVPRDQLGDLKTFSSRADQRGSATAPNYVGMPGASNGVRGATNASAPIRPGNVTSRGGFSGARSSGTVSSATSTSTSAAPAAGSAGSSTGRH